MSEEPQKEGEPEAAKDEEKADSAAEKEAAPEKEKETPKAAAAEDNTPEDKTAKATAEKDKEKDAPAAAASEADSPAEPKDEEEAEKSEKLKKAEEILKEGPRRDDDEDLFEKVVFINRCAKVVKGGRRFSFSALVVTGDKDGKVGFGFGKAQEVSECIKKASEAAKKAMIRVDIGPNTIPHPVVGRHGGGKVLLLPASPGTGLIAGGGVRAVVEAAGIKDVLAKSMGSNNHANVVKATLDGLNQLRTKEAIYASRGKRIPEKQAL